MKRPNAPTSASEIALFRRCQRAWAARYTCDDWPEFKDTKHFGLGTAYHKVVENYLRQGIIPIDPSDPLTEMLMCALPHLPAPGNFEAIERRDKIDIGDVPATVTADYVGRDPEGAVVLLDHKTSKDPTRYGIRTREEKLSDTQTVLYSFTYLRGTSGVWFDHIYIRKHKAALVKYEGGAAPSAPQAPKAYSTKLWLSSEELHEAHEVTCRQPAAELFQIRRKGTRVDPASLPFPASTDTCREYGGCPHIDRCHPKGLFGVPTRTQIGAEPVESLAQWLAKRKAGASL